MSTRFQVFHRRSSNRFRLYLPDHFDWHFVATDGHCAVRETLALDDLAHLPW